MATLTTAGRTVRLELTTTEKIAALRSDLEIRKDQVVDVGVERRPFAAIRGIRAPGFALPRRVAIGRWRHRKGADLVVVRRGEEAVRVDLDETAPFRRLLIGTDDAAAVVRRLRR